MKNNKSKFCMKNRPWYYFDDMIKFEYFNSDILIDKKSYENVSIYNILYKNLISAKPLRISFNKTDEFIRIYDGNKFLVLSSLEKYDVI